MLHAFNLMIPFFTQRIISVLFNGFSTRPFDVAQRGVRQGSSLISVHFYVLKVSPISFHQNREIQGIPVRRREIKLQTICK